MSIQVFILLIITIILWGSTPIIEKMGLQTTEPFRGLVIRSLFVAFVLISVCFVAGKWSEVLDTPLKDKVLFSFSGLLAGLLGMLTYFLALKIIPVSKAVPIAASYPFVAAILGVVILGENITLLRVMGTLFIIAGVWLVKS